MTQAKPTIIKLSQEQFDTLPEYSLSFPTGRTRGGKWKSQVIVDNKLEWLQGMYIDSNIENMVGIEWHIIQVVTPVTTEERLMVDDLKQDVEPPDNGQET